MKTLLILVAITLAGCAAGGYNPSFEAVQAQNFEQQREFSQQFQQPHHVACMGFGGGFNCF